MHVLSHSVDLYKGVNVDDECCSKKGTNVVEFKHNLKRSVTKWREEGKRGVWLQIALDAAHLIPATIEQGFTPHHVTPTAFVFTCWLPANETNKLPPGASHFIGVAGFVLNSKRQLLCVQEQSGPAAGHNFWKLPGGLCDPHEDIRAAAEREVLEETGISAEFSDVSCVSEFHHTQPVGLARTGATDLYLICVLKLRDETQRIVKQDSEIADCQWVDVDIVLAQRFFSKDTAMGHSMRVALEVAENRADGLAAERLPFGPRRSGSCSMLVARL